MKFFGYYGCSDESNEIVLKAKSKEAALNYVYENACEAYDNHYHHYYDSEVDEEFIDDERELDIVYYVEPFDYENETHLDVLNAQEGNFWEV